MKKEEFNNKFKRKISILIIDDSKGKQFNGINTTYVEELKKELDFKPFKFDLKIIAKDYYTTFDAIQEINSLKNKLNIKNPDFLIINLGINDCSPRLLTKKWCDRLMMLPKPIAFFIRKYIIRKYKPFWFNLFGSRLIVSADEFKSNIELLCNTLKPKKVILMNIAPANNKLESKLPSINKNINEFNLNMSLLAKEKDYIVLNIYKLIDNNGREKSTIDGVHYFEETCKTIAEKLKELIVN